MTALSGLTLVQASQDTDYWGRLVESAIGKQLRKKGLVKK